MSTVLGLGDHVLVKAHGGQPFDRGVTVRSTPVERASVLELEVELLESLAVETDLNDSARRGVLRGVRRSVKQSLWWGVGGS